MTILKTALLHFGISLVGLLCLSALIYGAAYQEMRDVQVNVYAINMPQWEKGLPPVRVAVLGDLHAKKWDGEQLRSIVEQVRRQAPDLILLAGDYVDANRRDRAMSEADIAQHLAPLPNIAPTYYVWGNHDIAVGCNELGKAFAQLGIKPIEERSVTLQFSHKRSLTLRGVRYFEGDGLHLKNTFSQDKELAPAPLLVLSHTPAGFDRLPLAAPDLIVAAHTHGGQICTASGTPLTDLQGWTRDQLRAGLKLTPSGKPLFITRGIGWSRAPLRVFCRPEIAILDLM